MFRVPSSTPPSTPDSRRSSRFAPSTTPAGPPPDHSFIPSSTPAGPPPAANSLFGNSRPTFEQPSRFNFGTSTLASSPPKSGLFEGTGLGAMRASTAGRPASHRRMTSSSAFRVPSSPPRAEEEEDEDAEGEEDEDMDEDAEGDEDEEMEQESDEDDFLAAQHGTKASTRLSQSVASRTSAADSQTSPVVVRAGAKQSQYDLLSIAKGLTPSLGDGHLNEADDTILETERLMEKLNQSYANDTPRKRTAVLGDIARELQALWTKAATASNRPSALTVAQLASLLVSIHHPDSAASPAAITKSSFALVRTAEDRSLSIPKILLDWLNRNRPIQKDLDIVFKKTEGYSRHRSYWDAVLASASRGLFSETMELLSGARFEVAQTAKDDCGSSGYSGAQLQFATEAVNRALEILEECPAVHANDWDIKGHDWGIFRQRVEQAFSDLEELAEGDSKSKQSVARPLEASNFGITHSQSMFHLSTRSRKAECRVPWTIYQNLAKLYRLLLGNEEEIFMWSADWVEATLCLAIWWDGDEESANHGSLAASRRSLARSQRVRTVDVTPVKAYTERLAAALTTVLQGEDQELAINTTDRFEVGLACILDDNVEATLQILRGASLVMASAVAEVATAGEWFMRADGILSQFDKSDLMVLSYTDQQRSGLSQDDLLMAYAKLLTSRAELRSSDGATVREGWELAIQVLGRANDTHKANMRIEQILDQLPLQSTDQVDKVTRLCHDLGLSSQAQAISMKFADHLRTNSRNYGDTLLYYARAHASSKIQEVLRVLVAHCLVKSIAYPPLDDLDSSLKSLITTPKQTLTKLSAVDSEAAQLLSDSLSGYATIRKFYDLRDEEVLLQEGEKPAHRPMARKRAAANALMVIISSAASSIRGGLYDPDAETAVQVDVLLPLLGEALVFIDQPKRILTLRHLYTLLSAVEDLSTAPGMIQTQCEEVLTAALPTGSTLGKSTSNLTTASSQYSLIGSTDLGSVQGLSTESSAVLVKGATTLDDAKRGWDWRRGFPRGVSGDDLLRVLRLGIAKELGRAFAEGEVTPA